MLLQDYISTLLEKHNCVIVPDFGGFVANYKSAVIDEFSKKIHPPSKSVLFNAHLTNNDGLLGNYIALDKSVDYSAALTFVSTEVKIWRDQLANNERVDFGEIGFLYQKEGQIRFEQSRETNLLLSAYGLRSIDFVRFTEKEEQKVVRSVETTKIQRPIEKKVIATEPEIIEELITPNVEVEPKKSLEKKPVQTLTIDKSKKIKKEEVSDHVEIQPEKTYRRGALGTVVRYTAAAIFVPVLFYSYWIPMETDALDTQLIQFSDFNPIKKQAERGYDLRHDVGTFEEFEEHKSLEELTENINASVYNFELLEDFYVPVSLQKEDFALTEEIDKTEVVSPEQTNSFENSEVQRGNYHVISGCFSVQNNANNLVSDLNSQGFSAQILDKKGGLHRVSAGAFSTKDAAKNAVSQLQSSGFSGWVLKY